MENAGDILPHNDVEKTINIVRSAYGWTLDDHGRLYGLVSGDMGYAATHIVLDEETLAIWKRAYKSKKENK
jgi:hypothetical protein